MPLTMLVTASVRLPSISSSLPLTIEITPTTVNPMPEETLPVATEAVIPKIVSGRHHLLPKDQANHVLNLGKSSYSVSLRVGTHTVYRVCENYVGFLEMINLICIEHAL
jgi:hypothetical protein